MKFITRTLFCLSLLFAVPTHAMIKDTSVSLKDIRARDSYDMEIKVESFIRSLVFNYNPYLPYHVKHFKTFYSHLGLSPEDLKQAREFHKDMKFVHKQEMNNAPHENYFEGLQQMRFIIKTMFIQNAKNKSPKELIELFEILQRSLQESIRDKSAKKFRVQLKKQLKREDRAYYSRLNKETNRKKINRLINESKPSMRSENISKVIWADDDFGPKDERELGKKVGFVLSSLKLYQHKLDQEQARLDRERLRKIRLQKEQAKKQKEAEAEKKKQDEAMKRAEKARKEILADEFECKVCMNATINSVCIPCGHASACKDCVPQLHNKCPICSKPGTFYPLFVQLKTALE